MVLLAASGMALCPLEGLRAQPIEAMKAFKNMDQPMAEAHQGLVLDPALSPTPNARPKISSAFSSEPLQAASEPSLMAFPATSLADVPEPFLESLAETSPDPSPSALLEPSHEAADPIYGTRGSQRWYVQAGAATTLDDEAHRLGLVGVGLSHFFLAGHSINLELNGMAFAQPGADAVGLNLALLLRWDFIRQPDWSLYIDGGAGILGTTNDVPSPGSSFNFTPQVGGGATIRLDNGNRLMLGVRWHHISNGNLYENNPGQDTILGYVGINFPR